MASATAEEIAAHPEPVILAMAMQDILMPPSFFNISAMSFGAYPAVSALSAGRTAVFGSTPVKAGCSPFTGPPAIVFQIGTAKYGVRDQDGNLDPVKVTGLAANPAVKMFSKTLPRRKTGQGGILPGEKVTEVIASTRVPVGQDSIS